ncbi:MAG: SurA N-terminal domain-containing protein [Gallionellaceae bacterium]
MFDFVHENRRLIQIVLALIILPFAFWGVDSYRRSAAGEALATVNGEKIGQQEFDNALRQQEDRMRELMGDKFDPAMFDKPEIKHSVLDNLVSQRLMTSQAQGQGLTVSDAQLAQVISEIGAFQKDGKFDKERYESALRSQNMTPPIFEERVRQELSLRQLTDAYNQNGYASNTIADRLIHLNEQQRVVSTLQVLPDSFLKQVKVDDAEIKKYYENNTAEFQSPERVRVEYVTFAVDSLLPQIKVDEAEVRKYYEDHQPEFGIQEQRHAAHILISVSPQASDADKQAAKAKAEQVLQQVRQSPGKFADFARQYSQDTGSAANGGDLGMFTRGMMVKPFEDVAFKLKPGEISGLVQSDFGFHIIKLLSIVPAKMKPLSEVKGEIEQKLKLQKANDEFADLADKFNNTVYEQSDSLKPAAELVKAQVQQSSWLSKGQAGGMPWTDKALQAVFTNDVLKAKRNSAVVEIGPNNLLAARMLEYKPASTRSLAEVSESIRQKLMRQQAMELASKQGQDILARLQHGENPKLDWKGGQTITRMQPAGLSRELVQKIFQTDSVKLPAYAGMQDAQKGYVLVRIDAVKEGPAIDDAKRDRYLQEIRKLTGEEMYQAYLADARKHADIKIKAFEAEAKK